MREWVVVGGSKIESFDSVLQASKRAGELLQMESISRVIVMSKSEYLSSDYKKNKRGKNS